MSTIVTIQSTDLITNSRADINTNFANLNTDKFETSNIDTDTTLAANSDTKVASQKATKAYVDAQVTTNASETAKGAVEEATDAEVAAATATGATGAKLFITPAKLLTHEVGLPPRAFLFSTAFEASGRFTSIVNGGTNTFGTSGLSMDTTGTATRAAGVTLDLGSNNGSLFLGSPVFTCLFSISATSGNADAYFGLGTVSKTGAGHTFTSDHAGFKITSSAAVLSLYGTQANGTTETATSALTTLTTNDSIEVMLKINGSASIDYYYRKNGGSWSTATNLTTNMPDTASNQMQFSVSNISTAQTTTIAVGGASYSR